MRKLRTARAILAMTMACMIAVPAIAQDSETSVEAVFVSSKTANLRQQPSTSAEIVGKVYYNDALQLLGSEGAWYKVANPFTSGETAYISNTVGSEGSFTVEYTPLYSSFTDSSTSFADTECKGKGAAEKCTTTDWSFTYPGKKFLGPVIICKNTMVADASGRSNGYSEYYKGVSTPAHILVTETCDESGNVTGSVEPFIISHVSGMDEEGVVIKGHVYNTASY